MTPPLIICMGVSGAGKSTCGRKLAAHFDLSFVDADDLHPMENKQKMQAGTPLTDVDREPWMQAVCQRLGAIAKGEHGCVLAHSALRRAHRTQLRGCGLRTLFLHLDGSRETIARRLGKREGHFMPAALLNSQLSDLQPVNHEQDVITLDTALDIAELMFHATSVSHEFISQAQPSKE